MKILTIYTAALASAHFDIIQVMMVFCVLLVFLATWGINRISSLRIKKRIDQMNEMSAIMQHTLGMSHSYVLKLDLRQRKGYNLHGDLLPSEGMEHEESFEHIHPDDRAIYASFISRLFHGEAGFAECTFRWNMSKDEGKEEWRLMRDKGVAEFSNGKDRPPTAIFCTMTDQTETVRQEKEEAQLTEKYRMMFEQSIVGLAFYDNEGRLLAANQQMREILKFQSEHDSYYYSRHLYDLPTFRNLIDNRRVEELYFCTKSIIIERGVNCYTELRLHPIYDDNDELTYIALSIRDVTLERELYLQNKRNDEDIRRANEEIQQYENELQYLMDACNMRFFRTSFKKRVCYFYKTLRATDSEMDFGTLMDHFIDSPFKKGLEEPEKYFDEPKTTLTRMHPFFHEGDELQWNFIDSVPYYDEHGELAGSYGVVRNVNDLIEKQEKLKLETERAQDSGRMKSVFMANMTHEIRTPLNSIVGFSDILPMLSTPEEKQEIIRVIMNNCDMLLRLINDILAVSSLDDGGIHIEVQKVDFARSFNDICESLRQRVQEPGVEFIKENPYQRFETCIDNGRIQQVVTNFVTNAVKYTHQGHIKVGYRYENGGLYIYCEDTGDGIPKESQSKIFDRFVKLNDYIQGTGLGLSICKAIADGCKGKIGIHSEGKGQGSTFWIWIPCEDLNSENKE